jgi:hypothetical protein
VALTLRLGGDIDREYDKRHKGPVFGVKKDWVAASSEKMEVRWLAQQVRRSFLSDFL